MTIYVTGDVHGNPIDRFCTNPQITEQLTSDDTVVFLGDIGVPWPHDDEENERQLQWLSEKPWKNIFVLGNHDNYDWAENQLYGCSHISYNDHIYDNISVYWNIETIYLEGKRILLIPGAESHDCDFILDPDSDRFQEQLSYCLDNHVRFRVLGLNYWNQEKVDIETVAKMAADPSLYGRFDYVLSHDYPGAVNEIWKRPGHRFRLAATDSQEALERLRETLDFDQWYHGHAHDPWMPWDHIDGRIHCIYKTIERLS